MTIAPPNTPSHISEIRMIQTCGQGVYEIRKSSGRLGIRVISVEEIERNVFAILFERIEKILKRQVTSCSH
jgi:hypothetical protein